MEHGKRITCIGPIVSRNRCRWSGLHGGGGNGLGLRTTYGFQPLIEAGELIAVYPDAGRDGWLPDDVPFLDACIDAVLRDERIDGQRLYITGASRGGLMTLVMTQQSKHEFQAAETVIASYLQGLADEIPLKKPANVCMIAGTDDPLMPYRGGWGSMRKPKTSGDPGAKVLPVEEVVKQLTNAAKLNSDPITTKLPDRDRDDGCTTEVRYWSDTSQSRQVLLVKVIGGGHVVPGGRQYLPKTMIGAASADFDHVELMWEFFNAVDQKRAPKFVSGTTEVANTEPPQPDGEASEEQLRATVKAMFEATRSGDFARCLELTDPSVIKKRGEADVRKFFRGAHTLMKITKLGPDDQRIDEITLSRDGQTAVVKTAARLRGRWQRPGTENWIKTEDGWKYQEAKK